MGTGPCIWAAWAGFPDFYHANVSFVYGRPHGYAPELIELPLGAILGTRYPVPGTWCQVPGTQYQVLAGLPRFGSVRERFGRRVVPSARVGSGSGTVRFGSVRPSTGR